MEQVIVQLKDGEAFVFDVLLDVSVGDCVIVNLDDDIDIGIIIQMFVEGSSVGRVLDIVEVYKLIERWDAAYEKDWEITHVE